MKDDAFGTVIYSYGGKETLDTCWDCIQMQIYLKEQRKTAPVGEAIYTVNGERIPVDTDWRKQASQKMEEPAFIRKAKIQEIFYYALCVLDIILFILLCKGILQQSLLLTVFLIPLLIVNAFISFSYGVIIRMFILSEVGKFL